MSLVRGTVAAGLAGLGLVGGAAAVSYKDDGTAEVTVTNKQGQVESVTIAGGNGKTYSCPAGTDSKLEPVDVRAGRIKITMRQLRRQIKALDARYPDHRAPAEVADRYNRMVKRDHRLVDAFNEAIDEHNAILEADCTRS